MSNLSAFPYIPERAEATPALWNNIFSVLSANDAALNSTQTISFPSGTTLSVFSSIDASGNLHAGNRIGVGPVPSADTVEVLTIGADSSKSDYILFHDPTGAKSSYVIGSHVGGTGDGLNLYDVSGSTMIANFSKQSIRFYAPVVGASFDVGGSDFNVRAFGAVGDDVADDTAPFLAAIAALPSTGGVISMPSGTYRVTDTLNFSFASTGKTSITLRGTGILATRIHSTVTNRPAIISNDTFNSNTFEGFDLYQVTHALPVFRAGNYGIRNVGGDAPYLALRNLNVRFFGDTGIRLEAGNGPFVLQDIAVQSCASYGIHLIPLGTSTPVEVQIIGGNIHECIGGLRLTGAASTGVYDTDIELGTVALYPALVIDGASRGGVFNDLSLSVQAIPSPAAVVSISNGVGMVFNGGQYTTASANVDAILLDSTAARLNTFHGGHFEISGGGWYAQCINGAKQNFFISPNLFGFAAGKGMVKNSTDTGDAVLFVGSSAVSDDRTLVLGGGNIAVGSGTALLPSMNFGGTSEVSLGFYRSGASIIQQSYGILALSALSVGGVIKTRPASGGIVIQEDGLGNVGASLRLQSSTAVPWWGVGMSGAAGSNATHLFFASFNQSSWLNVLRMSVEGQLLTQTGTSLLPPYAISSESSLGFYRSGASRLGLSYGQFTIPDGSNTTPSIGLSSATSVGFYSSGVQTIAQSLGTLNLATNSVRLSMRTIAASALTASAANTNVAVNEVVFTIQASGASFAINSGGTTWLFNSDASAKNT